MAAIRTIAQMGHPILRQVSTGIVCMEDPDIRLLANDLLETAIQSKGVGLAAPQVFESLRMIVIASRPSVRYPHAPELPPVVMVNPELLWASNEKESGWEGCLSIPGLRGLVPRHLRIGVRYLTMDGEEKDVEYEGFPARVFQHEFDHLQGVLFIDRLESLNDLVTEQEYQRRLTEKL
ncbi:MAG: peptide deformylase [Chlorobiaceae bacterium]|nr:peptide deformylase [Chlorobiaceae bacterium]